jgi:hypothetical protein
MNFGKEARAEQFTSPISTSIRFIGNRLAQINPYGPTALGPALLVSLGLAYVRSLF